MKNKLICLLLAIMMLVSSMFVLASCGGGEENPPDNGDGNGNGNGNGNGTDVGGGDNNNQTGEPGYPWDTTDLFFMMTDNSNAQELPSGCKAYLAGEDTTAIGDIYDDVKARNLAAQTTTKVFVDYDYYPDTDGYGWSGVIDDINLTVMSGDEEAPDIYCNFIYDMVATSLIGSFANLRSTSRGNNYFTFVDRAFNGLDTGEGYMYEYMTSLTLSKFKMYVLASDYFIDLIRAFFIVPVNINLINEIVGQIDGERTDDNVTDIQDFYEMVKAGEWDYKKMAAYCAAVYSPSATGGTPSLDDDKVGFALGTYSGLPSSGIVYTTSVTIIEKEWNDEENDYDYWYPATNPELVKLSENLKTLFEGTGVITVSGSNNWGATDLQGIRNRFATGHVLFGGIICVGSLEYTEYQNMKKADSVEDASKGYGFGLAPVPLYRSAAESGDRYLTQIHNVGRAGGISAMTTKFSQCSAFLNYQSHNSTDILNNYYNVQLQYAVSDGSAGNTYMLQYIRANVRTSFDKAFEDAIAEFYEKTDPNAGEERWNVILQRKGFQVDNMQETYAGLYDKKEGNLQKLVNQYTVLPD